MGWGVQGFRLAGGGVALAASPAVITSSGAIVAGSRWSVTLHA